MIIAKRREKSIAILIFLNRKEKPPVKGRFGEESTLKAYVLLRLREIPSAAPPFMGAMAKFMVTIYRICVKYKFRII